jgi:hypothetical protein
MTEGSRMQLHHARSHPRRLAVALPMAVNCMEQVSLTNMGHYEAPSFEHVLDAGLLR